ncbi:unnamed protein product [Polarella glacialis]|uniref:D-xylose 1-dehydrogenase (NADP(+), D-xylono-1,5-lactone-forming) n=1 Tax=Polarella glacialis TaxID=89957 RepID=A0A813JCY4_POLGL|nr:unnamed protein product [Polarella glacialis]CAE8679091.1 unnamed protein product [Polarella glacialis]CAE8703525.1 unnamed protein product [Polarella glacialis]
MSGRQLRIGVLGAARHVPTSLLEPLKKNRDLSALIEVVALADQSEAESSAKKWGIKRAYASIEELLADPEVDAVYNVLPLALRCQASVLALQAGKHVLSEAPLCSNAREAVVLQRAAEDAGKVMLEGSHPSCHPVTKRLREMVMEGKVGKVDRINVVLPVGITLYGSAVCAKVGALMGVGSYCVGLIRLLAGEEPRVISAAAMRSTEHPDVDVSISCDLALPSGGVAHFSCSVNPEATEDRPAAVTIRGCDGVIQANEWFLGKGKTANTIALEMFENSGEKHVEILDTKNVDVRDTFYYQLVGFADEIRHGGSHGMPWDYTMNRATPSDAVRNLALIDAIYRAAGFQPKATLNPPAAPYDRIGLSKL